MREFKYRDARFSSNLPVRILCGGEQIVGVLTEMSRDGMTVKVDRSLPEAAASKVVVSFEQPALSLEAKVIHAERGVCGMRIIYRSKQERVRVDDLMASVHARGRAN